jgi:ElaB/YqjD/DUF883 family membrane-anchored ribosome-binding protein
MTTPNGKNAQDMMDDVSERWNDFGRDFNKNANDVREKVVEQLRDLSARINKEAKSSDLDERFGVQIDRITAQVDTLADYLNKTDVETMGNKASQVVKANPWLAVALAFFAGVWLARFFGGKR